jgi:hypothetical protein
MALVRSLTILAFATSLFAQTPGGSVEGRITNSVTGEGIPAVNVILSSPVYLHAYTDDQGAYRIEGVKEGEYRVALTRSGFIRPQANQSDVWVRVSEDGTTRLDGTLAPWPSLRGLVIDPEGKPAPEIHVKPSRDLDEDSITDEEGAFSFEKVEPGRYTLMATPKAPLAPTFFPSALELAGAQEIQVQGGADLSGYRIQLRSAPVFKVRGVVLDPSGRPASQAKVTLFTMSLAPIVSVAGFGFNDPHMLEQGHTVSGEDGAFEFSAVYPGEWRVRAESIVGYDDARRRDVVQSGLRVANVASRDIEHLEVQLADAFAMDVALDGAEELTHPGPIMLLRLDGPGGGSDSPQTHRIENLFPGRYSVLAPNRVPGYYVSQVLLGGRDVLNREFELSGPGVLRVVYKHNGGTVRGTVEHGAGAFVLLFPRAAGFAKTGLLAACGAGGAFSVTDIPPGDYEAIAVYIPEGERNLAAFNSVSGFGKDVRVQESTTTLVELRVSPWP